MGCAASMIVEQTGRGDARLLAMCERSATIVLDHGTATLPSSTISADRAQSRNLATIMTLCRFDGQHRIMIGKNSLNISPLFKQDIGNAGSQAITLTYAAQKPCKIAHCCFFGRLKILPFAIKIACAAMGHRKISANAVPIIGLSS
jgi:hypothetical protein